MRKNIYLFLASLFLFSSYNTNAQWGERSRSQPKTIYGKVVEEKTGKGIEAASVQLFVTKNGDSTAQAKDSLVAGMFTEKNGDFKLENLTQADSFRLMISAIGFATVERSVVFNKYQHGNEDANTNERDLGNIALIPEAEQLQTVVVTGQKPALQLGIDRRVFNVEKSLVATGGTAIDVMKNIPSVTVSVDGGVELRGNTPQIFVDGMPTILTLDQIPADNIEKVELITNPSAKFDAASGAGIINIVLKKNKRGGLNGMISAGVGVPEVLNGNLTLNLRQNRFNFFASGNYNQFGGQAVTETFRQNKTNGIVTDHFTQYSTNDRMRRFSSARFGMDFFMDNRNTFSISQNFVRGRFSGLEHQDQYFYDNNNVLTQTGKRTSDGVSHFDRNSTDLTYKHQFVAPGRELTARFNYSFGGRDEETNIFNDYFKPDGSPDGGTNTVRNEGENTNKQYTFQADFISPFGPDKKIEAGMRSFINDYRSRFDAFSVDNGNETRLPLSNNYKYLENIHAAYFTYSNKWGSLKYQLGLRGEYSRFDGELVDSAQKFGYEYPSSWDNLFNALFPSMFITKSITEDQDLQFNYSRRIRRPNFWQMNPFIDITDPLNIRVGNPALQPEFINSFEINYNVNYEGGNFLASVFWRNNPNDITMYSDTITAEQYQKLNNAAVDPNAIVNTFINANVTNRYGTEFTLQHKIGRNFDITPTANFQYRKVKADVKDLNLDNEGFSWEGKLILNYKTTDRASSLFKNFSGQVIGEYESPEVIPQGRRKAEYSVDIALRKDFLKDKRGTLTFSVNDLFNTLRFGTIYDTESFYQDGYRRWNVRSFRLTFNYKFGNSDFKLFKRNENREGGDDNQIQSTRD